MKKFMSPEIELEKLEVVDVISTSAEVPDCEYDTGF